MRLQLIGLGAILLSVRGFAADGVAARVDVYTDEWITAVSPSTRGATSPADGVTVEAKYALDAVSGATQVLTVDAVSAATGFYEVRHEAHAGVQVAPSATWSFGADYQLSAEPDYVTHVAGASASAELLDRHATATLAYHVGFESAGRTTDAFRERTTSHALDASWQHVLDRRTTLTALATGQVARCGPVFGCAASPYRYVAVGQGGAPLFAVPERHPDLRARGAGALRIARHLGGGRALHAGYRFAGDSWAVIGHTADAALAQSFGGDAVVLRLDGRFTWQGAASFYRDTYATAPDAPRWRTADRELSGLWDAMAGARAEWAATGPGPIWRTRLNMRVARLWYRYPAFSELPERNAWLLGGGLDASW